MCFAMSFAELLSDSQRKRGEYVIPSDTAYDRNNVAKEKGISIDCRERREYKADRAQSPECIPTKSGQRSNHGA